MSNLASLLAGTPHDTTSGSSLSSTCEFHIYHITHDITTYHAIITCMNTWLHDMQWMWHNKPLDMKIWTPQTSSESDSLILESNSPHDIVSSSPLAHADTPHIIGTLQYGDNIEDEWLLVWLLLKITRTCDHVAVKIVDDDGHFLLIECSPALPAWFQPENSAHRCWLYQGDLHLIPRPTTPAQLVTIPVMLTPSRALNVLFDPNKHHITTTRASPEIQQYLQQRLNGFPHTPLINNSHFIRVLLPLRAAHILSQHPTIISHIIQTFATRDMIDMRHADKMNWILGKHETTTTTSTSTTTTETSTGTRTTSSPTTLIPLRVRFTRMLYAQLVQQPFQAPKILRALAPPGLATNATLRNAWEMGVKLTVGLEMLYQQLLGSWQKSYRHDHHISQRDITEQQQHDTMVALNQEARAWYESQHISQQQHDQIIHDPTWETYESQVKQHIPDITTSQLISSFHSQHTPQHPHHMLFTLHHIMLQPITSAYPTWEELPVDDSDAWRTVTLQDVDEILSKREGSAEPIDPSFDAHSVINSMHTFVNRMSGLEGVDIPTSTSTSTDTSIHAQARSSQPPNTSNPKAVTFAQDTHDVDMNVDRFMSMLRGHGALGDEDDADDDDEMGSQCSDELDELDEHEPADDEISSAMDTQLRTAGIGSEFQRLPHQTDPSAPVDINLNLLHNLLQSFQQQHGEAGPVSNLLGSMGITLPHDADQ